MAAKEAKARIKINKLLEVLKLPPPGAGEGNGEVGGTTVGPNGEYIHGGSDAVAHLAEEAVGPQGMKIDRMFFESFEQAVKADAILQQKVDDEQWEQAIDHVTAHLLDKPAEFYTLDKLRRAAGVDRRLTLREILEKIFGRIPAFSMADFKAVPREWRERVPEYVKDYVSLNQFM